MLSLINDAQIQRVLSPPNISPKWEKDLAQLKKDHLSLKRNEAGEHSIMALQRLLLFLGYSTSSRGAFSIDGDFGRGTNRGLAQFKFDQGLDVSANSRNILTYPCKFRTAHKLIRSIPDVFLDVPTLERLLLVAKEAIGKNEVNCGDFEEAIFHLNAVHHRKFLTCHEINEHYGEVVDRTVAQLQEEKNLKLQPEWILTIIKQETAGIVRPRFEQHWLSKLSPKHPDISLEELRYRSMSFGLGQIMGFNYKRVGASSAKALYTAPLEEQITFIARFLTATSTLKAVVAKQNPSADDFKVVARRYNGAAFAVNEYDEKIARKFKEFMKIRKG